MSDKLTWKSIATYAAALTVTAASTGALIIAGTPAAQHYNEVAVKCALPDGGELTQNFKNATVKGISTLPSYPAAHDITVKEKHGRKATFDGNTCVVIPKV
ncbi:MAG: hypothetical protein PW788_08980 [Micavibrio sp.]|nr:hypothetical protein [Micavibrio sp.]